MQQIDDRHSAAGTQERSLELANVDILTTKICKQQDHACIPLSRSLKNKKPVIDWLFDVDRLNLNYSAATVSTAASGRSTNSTKAIGALSP